MKKTVLVLIMALLHIAAVNLYAAPDFTVKNLTVEEQVAIGDATLDPQRTINASQSWDIDQDPNAPNGVSTVFSGAFDSTNYGTGRMLGFRSRSYSAHSDGTRTWTLGGLFRGLQDGTGTVTNLEGMLLRTGGNGTGVVEYNTPLDIKGGIGNTATETARGIYIRNFNIGSGSATNTYGIYLDEQTQGTNNYQIYSEGGTSYLGGSLGIGTTSPEWKLSVKASGSPDGIQLLNSYGNEIARLHQTGVETDGGVMLHMREADGGPVNVIIASRPGAKSFIANGGYVGIGTKTPQYELDVNGYIQGWNLAPSDIKFKKDIKAIESSLNKIMNISGVSYNWKREAYKDKGFPEGRHYGVIAQEVEKILPEVVKESPDGDKSVAYTELIPVLIEAVKEQQKVIEGLKAEVKVIEELKAEVNQLKAKGLVAGIQ